MIPPETMREMLKLKLNRKRAANKVVLRPYLNVNQQQLSDGEVWQRFVYKEDSDLAADFQRDPEGFKDYVGFLRDHAREKEGALGQSRVEDVARRFNIG